ncbi:AAA family ATPase [Veillonella sp. CHU740]|uniref:AAA family ATPase n=1 Tax=Veillonella sp. CHU740 TaxID=2490950 RepID=UPI000F8F159A|nr:SMC family ATPase [Veillonella sp. CHU740]
MRPLRLEMTAFGPYPKEVILDFAILANQSMFLITGPTGSGKTSILDAIVYALYGQTSGGLRDGSDMRSDYADATTPTSVIFEFQVGDHRYRMERTPKQELQKKRGTGTRTVLATASISEWIDDEWKLLTTKAQEIRDYVQQIIGFRVDQFLQVVLLPQGDFRKLLVAPTSEREVLLHTIFKTSVYKRMQDLLKEELAESTVGIQDTLQKVEFLLSTYTVDTLQDLVALMEEERKCLIEREGERKEKQHQYESLQATYVKHENYANLLARKEQYSKALASHKEGEKEHIALGEAIDRWERLEKIRIPLNQYEKLQVSFNTNKEKLDILETSLQSVAILLQSLDCKHDQLEMQADTYAKQQEQYHQLQALQQEVERHGELLEKRTALDMDQSQKVQQQSEVQETLATSQTNIEIQRQSLGEINLKLQSYSFLSEEKLCTSELRSWWDSLKGTVNKLQTAWDARNLHSQQLDKAHHVCKTREGLYHHNEQLLRQHQAYEVSLQVEDDAPCPVCGSLEHPQLAQAPSEDIVRETVDRLRQEFQASQTQVATIETKLAHSDEEVKRYDKEWNRLCEMYPKVTEEIQRISLVNLGKMLQKCSDTVSIKPVLDRIQSWQDIVDETEIDRVFKEIQKELVNSEKDKIELETKLSTLQTALQAEEANFHGKQLELTTLVGQMETINQDVLHLTSEIHRIEKSIAPFTVDTYMMEMAGLADSLKQYEADRKALEEERQMSQAKQVELTAEVGALEEQQVRISQDIESFGKDIQQVLAAESLTIDTFKQESHAFDELPVWKETFSAYHNESLRLTSLLEGVQQDLASYVTVPEKIPKELVESLQQELKNLGEVIGTLKSQVTAKEKTIQEISKLEADTKELSDRRTFIFGLADLANGGDTGMKGVSFERYVLGAILEEVLSAANLRLHDMSRGRYRLERSLEEGGRGARGLDIAVFDAYTGASRPANTLSGGETFLASLGLAMGLADVIQSYAGGIHLDTMFIDEGFGTLDPDTLDVAMETLVALQSQGRLVGIISHVPELQQQIGAHLVVTKTDEGSSAYFKVQ